MADVYPDGADRRIADPEWIKRADREGWIVLTKDPSIIRDHQDVLAETTLRVFAFNNANVAGAELVTRLESNFNRILQAVCQTRSVRMGDCPRRPGPSLAKALR